MISYWEILKHGEKVISSIEQPLSISDKEFNKNVGSAFDMILVSCFDGNYRLIIFMRIKMDYIKEAEASEWTIFEKSNFENKFNKVINDKWSSSHSIFTLTNNKRIFLDFRFSFKNQNSFFPPSHWTVTIRKIPNRYDGYQSLVNPSKRKVELDSQDFSITKRPTGTFQRGIVHEFGHLLGFDDEYQSTSKYYSDIESVMNTGENIRNRHKGQYMNWLLKTLKDKNLK